MPWLKTEEGAEQTGLQEGGNNFVKKEALLFVTVKAPQENRTKESTEFKQRGVQVWVLKDTTSV